MLYMTMIVAILILVFKKLNNIASHKIAKLKFEIQLDNLLIKEIVLLCGGNPDWKTIKDCRRYNRSILFNYNQLCLPLAVYKTPPRK